MMKISLLCLIFFYDLPSAKAQPGTQDSSFGTNGVVVNNFEKGKINSSSGVQVLSGPNGTVYVIGVVKGNTFITRRGANGAIDKTYGRDGFLSVTSVYPAQGVLQPDGKIVMASSSGFLVLRFNSNGTLDSTFGKKGVQSTAFGSNDFASAIAITIDGKIVVVGSTFDGTKTIFAIARYNSNGTPDSSFSRVGHRITDVGANSYASSVAVQSDGKIVMAGSKSTVKNHNSYYEAIIVRYNKDGSLDNAFSKDGKQTIKSDGSEVPNFYTANSVAVPTDEKIVIAGYWYHGKFADMSVVRLNTDGNLDSTFSNDGKQTTEFSDTAGVHASSTAVSLAIQRDGKIVLAGSSHGAFALARYKVDGSMDNSFSSDGKLTTDFSAANDYGNSAAIEADGKILIGGTNGDCEGNNCNNKFAVARYNSNGTLDDTFDKDGKLTGGYPSANTSFKKMAIQKDGKIVVIGTSDSKNFIARYSADGKSLDKTFGNNGIRYDNLSMYSVAIQKDQKIVVAADSLSRYNSDGTTDTTFGNRGKQVIFSGSLYSYPAAAAIQKDGKIVVVGVTTILDTLYDQSLEVFGIERYNTNGSIDSSFDGDGVQTANFDTQGQRPTSVAIQQDGKIVVVGNLFSGKHELIAMVRLNSNGSVDFAERLTSENDDYDVSTVAIQNDGKIVLMGSSIFRYNKDGSVDRSFSDDGKTTSPFNVSSGTIGPDGKIVVGGTTSSDFALARFNTVGNLDSTFNGTGQQSTKIAFDGMSGITDIAIHDNKIYAAGSLNNGIGYEFLASYGVMARYLLAGSAPPVVKITTPPNDTLYTAPGTIIIRATALPVNATISKVEFYNGVTLLHTETVYPYAYFWRNVPSGTYTLTAKATDSYGLTSTSPPVRVTVVSTKAPTVNIIRPVNNRIMAGPSNITLEAVAKDPDGSITKVEFYVGSTLLATVTDSPYTFVWKTIRPGHYSFTARATDNMGVVSTSTAVNITVVPNKAPTVHITDPANRQYFTGPANIQLIAAADDADGRITRVQFFNGNTLLTTELKLPYSYYWKNVPSGIYTITAVARDELGYQTTSAPVTLEVITPNAKIVRANSRPLDDKASFSEDDDLKITPNPATNILNIHLRGSEKNRSLPLSIFSASGVLVKSIQTNGSDQPTQVDISSLPAGVYMLKVLRANNTMYGQFVKL